MNFFKAIQSFGHQFGIKGSFSLTGELFSFWMAFLEWRGQGLWHGKNHCLQRGGTIDLVLTEVKNLMYASLNFELHYISHESKNGLALL